MVDAAAAVAIAIGAQHGLDWLFAAVVVAQVISTLTIGGVALAVFRRWPRVQAEPLGEDQPEIRSFAIQSTIASGLMSVRTSMPVVLIGIVAKPAEVANFRAALAPQTAFAALSAPVRLVLLAEQTRDIEYGRIDRAFALLRRYIVSAVAVGLVVTPILWWAMPTLIRWILKPKYLSATARSASCCSRLWCSSCSPGRSRFPCRSVAPACARSAR